MVNFGDRRTTTSAIPQFAREKSELVMANTGRGIMTRAQIAGRCLESRPNKTPNQAGRKQA